MQDLIDRQAAIDAFAEQMPTPYTPDGSHPADEQIFQVQEVYVDCITTIKSLPTIQPEVLACGNGELVAKLEPQWIPVSERLPEKGGEYLVSVHHTIGAISVLHPEKDTYVDDVAIMRYYGKFPSTVRAWMPLPEAYNPNK